MKIRSLWTLPWRNLWRNRRRSLVTVLSLAFGFAGVSLFAGYTLAIYTALANTVVHIEGTGHISINKVGWQTEGKLHPNRYILKPEEISTVRQIVLDARPGSRVIPQLTVAGLLSNGNASTVFFAMGIDPADQQVLLGPFRRGAGALAEGSPNRVNVAEGLAQTLGLHKGDSASILVSTVHGQANASDAEVGALFNSGSANTNDKLLLMPLELARNLYDVAGRAESLTIMLPEPPHRTAEPTQDPLLTAFIEPPPDSATTEILAAELRTRFRAAGLDLQVRPWQEMSDWYRQVKTMYDMIFLLMLCVVVALVVLSIANAMSMAVIERTREVGTLRAIGMRRSGIVRMFACEASLLVMLGSAIGLALTLATRGLVNAADIRYIPPGNTATVPLYIGFDAPRTALAAAMLALLAVSAAWFPARRAARQSIIDSLGHV